MEEKDIKLIPGSIQQIIYSDIGRYASNDVGLDSFYYIFNSINNIITHLVVNHGSKWLNDVITKEITESSMELRIKNLSDIQLLLKRLSPVVNDVKLLYDAFRNSEDKFSKYYNKVKKLYPHQVELFFIFNLLMKISGEQRRSIPSHYFRSPIKSTFDKNNEWDKY